MSDFRRTLQARTRLVRDAAELTGGRVFDLEDTQGLEAAFESISEDIDTRYLISFAPQSIAGSGWHDLEVLLENHEGVVTARRGYLHR